MYCPSRPQRASASLSASSTSAAAWRSASSCVVSPMTAPPIMRAALSPDVSACTIMRLARTRPPDRAADGGHAPGDDTKRRVRPDRSAEPGPEQRRQQLFVVLGRTQVGMVVCPRDERDAHFVLAPVRAVFGREQIGFLPVWQVTEDRGRVAEYGQVADAAGVQVEHLSGVVAGQYRLDAGQPA